MCKRVDYTFPYGTKRYAHSIMTESIIESDENERPYDIVSVKKYKPIPLSYRDKLKEIGFVKNIT